METRYNASHCNSGAGWLRARDFGALCARSGGADDTLRADLAAARGIGFVAAPCDPSEVDAADFANALAGYREAEHEAAVVDARREVHRVFGGDGSVESTEPRVLGAVSVAYEGGQGPVVYETEKLLRVLRGLADRAGATEDGDAEVCRALDAAGARLDDAAVEFLAAAQRGLAERVRDAADRAEALS